MQSHLALHDSALAHANRGKELKKLLAANFEQMNALEKEFEPLEKAIGPLIQRLQDLINHKPSWEKFNKLSIEFNKWVDACIVFDKKSKLQHEEMNKMTDLYDKHEEAWERYGEELMKHDELWYDLDSFPEKYSLDRVSYFDEIEKNFRQFLDDSSYEEDKWLLNEQNKYIDRCDAFVERINIVYHKYEEMDKQLNEETVKFLADTSKSEYFASHPGKKEGKPVYFLPPGNEIIEDYRDAFQQFVDRGNATINITTPVSFVNEESVVYMQETFIALQHYPNLIEKAVFSVVIKFEEIEGSGIILNEDDWKAHPKFMRWFNSLLSAFSPILFFLNDQDARAYMVMGDLIADEKFEFIADATPGREGGKFSGEDVQIINDRLFHTCWQFILYCHNSGYDPIATIEALLADMNATFTYEDVKKAFDKDIAKGIQLRMGRK